MTKYAALVRRPRIWIEDDTWYSDTNNRSLTVFEEDAEPQETGLLDAEGRQLYRVIEKAPMGFTKAA